MNKIMAQTADRVLAAAKSHIGSMDSEASHVDDSPYPGPELLLADEVVELIHSYTHSSRLFYSTQVVELMGRQFDSLDADGGGSIEKHEVPPEIWKELDTHFNKDGDEFDRNDYIAAVKVSGLQV
jgi:hypothetical protein